MNSLNRPTSRPLHHRLAALCLALFCAGATTARAATITVTSTADTSDPGTLRNALASAADGDTIELPAGAVFQMGTIFHDADNFMGPTATPMITLTIIIEANGSRLEHIPNGVNFRAFAVAPSGNLTIRNAHIKGFTFKGGDGADGGGGGMGAGGAIYVQDGTLTVENSTFEGNGAAGGNGGSPRFMTPKMGGGGGLSGTGGLTGLGGGGGGGGARGNGGAGGNLTTGVPGGFGPDMVAAAGGGGGGTVANGQQGGGDGMTGGAGGVACGGTGGNANQPGSVAPCSGGGGGGGGTGQTGGVGGIGNYGGGGGGSGQGAIPGGTGGFGGGGGSEAGRGGFGGGGGDQAAGGPFGGFGAGGGGGGGGGLGGAIFNDGGTVIIRNCTFTANFVTRGPGDISPGGDGADAGGAIFSRNGLLLVFNSTISGNESTGTDGGISVFEDGFTTSFSLWNTIIANNGADECHSIGNVTPSGSGNLIVQNLGCPGNQPTATDPQLGPLQLNTPGSTPTMAIDANSPAFDAGDDANCQPFDQRGVPRAQFMPCDIGAYEVEKNRPPEAKCKDMTVSAGTDCTADASIDDGSFDPDAGDTITLVQSPPGPYGLGTTSVTLTVTDNHGVDSSCTATVTVNDTTTSVITLKPSIAVLQNNHKYRTFNVTDFVASVQDNCSALTVDNCVIGQVTSDEPDNSPDPGDGNTKNDIKIASACKSVQLQQERDGTKNGRVYKITLKVKDTDGNVGQAVSTVSVPLSSNQMPAIDSGVAFTVNGCTP